MESYALNAEDIEVWCKVCGGSGFLTFAGIVIKVGTCTCGDYLPLEFILDNMTDRVRGETYDLLGVAYPERSQS